MDKKSYDVVIVGNGFTGLSAVDILCETNLKILVVDENPHLGGQLIRKIPETLGEYESYSADAVKKVGFNYIKKLKQKKLDLISRAKVLGIYPGNELLLEIGNKKILHVHYKTILLATGARERFLPFPGWTLPGVYSTGLIQVLSKSNGVMAAKEILIGGSGLFLYAVGYEILRNGGKVLGILEQSALFNKMKMLGQFFHQAAKFTEGAKYLAKIYSKGVPVRYRTKILEARGKDELEEVVTCKVDASGNMLEGTEKVIPTKALAVGYGFVPNIELPQVAGCELEHHEERGGWIVKVNEGMESTVPGIYAAGEITGIAGAQKSITDGQLAAYSILNFFEKIDPKEYQQQKEKLNRIRQHHLDFGKHFNLLYKTPDRMVRDIPDHTMICRCEDVTMKDIKDACEMGCNNPGGLKIVVRTGMGNCQGRTCGPIIYDLLAQLHRKSPADIGVFNSRPPVKSIFLNSFID